MRGWVLFIFVVPFLLCGCPRKGFLDVRAPRFRSCEAQLPPAVDYPLQSYQGLIDRAGCPNELLGMDGLHVYSAEPSSPDVRAFQINTASGVIRDCAGAVVLSGAVPPVLEMFTGYPGYDLLGSYYCCERLVEISWEGQVALLDTSKLPPSIKRTIDQIEPQYVAAGEKSIDLTAFLTLSEQGEVADLIRHNFQVEYVRTWQADGCSPNPPKKTSCGRNHCVTGKFRDSGTPTGQWETYEFQSNP